MPTDLYDLDRRAIELVRAQLATLAVADLDRLSVCDGWDVRAIVAHLVGGNIRFAAALRGEPVDWSTRNDEVITAPLAEFEPSALLMAAAVAAIDDPDRPTALEAGEPSARFAVGVHGADMLLHGWDLAVSTGQDADLDPLLCAAAIKVIEQYPPSFWGPGRFFASALVPRRPEPQDRLLALTGREFPPVDKSNPAFAAGTLMQHDRSA